MTKHYTINDIQAEVSNSGSHWFDRDSMRFFGTRLSDTVYQGNGGIFFVTSEKNPSGVRRYSVRSFCPDTKSIDTIGDFHSMTRDQAHRLARTMAGGEAIESVSPPIKTTKAEQLKIDINRNGGRCSIEKAKRLIRLAKRHHKVMEDYCNGSVAIYDADSEPTKAYGRLIKSIAYWAKDAGCSGVKISGDPRGCTVKLILPSGETNDWGKEGWCVPTT